MTSPSLLAVSDPTYSSRGRSISLLPPSHHHIQPSSAYLSSQNPYQHHLRHHRSQPHFPVASTLGRPATPRRPSALDLDHNHGSRPSHHNQAFAPFASPSSSKIISSSSLLPSSSSSSSSPPSPSDILHDATSTYAHGSVSTASPPLSPIDLDADSDTHSENKSQRRLRRSSFAFIRAAVTPRIKHEHEHRSRSRTAEALDMDFACCGPVGFEHHLCHHTHHDPIPASRSSNELPHFRCCTDITVQLEGAVIQGDVLGLGFGIGTGMEGVEVGLDYSDKESSSEETMGACACDSSTMGSGHRQEKWTRSWTRWKGKTFPVFKGRSESTLDGTGLGIGGDLSVSGVTVEDAAMMACGPNIGTKRRSKMWCLASWREMENAGLLGQKSRVVHHGQRVRGVSASAQI